MGPFSAEKQVVSANLSELLSVLKRHALALAAIRCDGNNCESISRCSLDGSGRSFLGVLSAIAGHQTVDA